MCFILFLMRVPAYVKHVSLIALFVVATVNFTKTTLDVIDSSRRLDEMRNDVSELGSEKEALEKDLEYKKSDGFIEQEAREKLGLVKPGEELFVVDGVLGVTTHNADSEAVSRQFSRNPNVQEWLELFL